LQWLHQFSGIGSGISSSESAVEFTEDAELALLEEETDLELEADVDELEELQGIGLRCLDLCLAATANEDFLTRRRESRVRLMLLTGLVEDFRLFSEVGCSERLRRRED
jgi:hypothetical protein